MRGARTMVSLIGVALTALGAAAQDNANTGLECWGLATGDAVASSSWPAKATKVDCSATDTQGVANKTAANTTSYQETSAEFAASKFCVQINSQGTSWGGCLSQVTAQIKCNFDGQKQDSNIRVAGVEVDSTILCCATSLCNSCTNGFAAKSTPSPASSAGSNSSIGQETTASFNTTAPGKETAASFQPAAYECAAAATPVPASAEEVSTALGASVTFLAFETFALPSPEVLASQGFEFKFSDPQYAGIGAAIPAGAWPVGDTRSPSLAIYEAKDHHLEAKSEKKGSEVAGLLVDFQPSPIVFLKPVTVTLPVYEIDQKRKYVVAVFNTTSKTWLPKPVSKDQETIVDGQVLGETSSFSLYAALSYPASSSSCNAGCIVGSVIGGLAGAVCLALGARYFFCNGEPDEGAWEEPFMDPVDVPRTRDGAGHGSSGVQPSAQQQGASAERDTEGEDGDFIYDV